MRTSKRGRVAHIPITQALADVIDATPADQMLILTNATGGPSGVASVKLV